MGTRQTDEPYAGQVDLQLLNEPDQPITTPVVDKKDLVVGEPFGQHGAGFAYERLDEVGVIVPDRCRHRDHHVSVKGGVARC